MIRLMEKGKIVPKSAKEIRHSKIGLGFEKLDRDVFDPEKAYDYVERLGVKWVRLQSGWQRTERTPGVYDFGWLDKIVDRFVEMRVEPWLCLCYGNELYSEDAKKYYGAVGCPPIYSEAEKKAWQNYVTATVTHFKGRIHYYEVWNEPDGRWCWKQGPNPVELAAFTKATSLACKAADPDCEVLGPALAYGLDEFSENLKKTDILDYLDGLTYHAYRIPEEDWNEKYRFYRDWIDASGKNIKLIQGESGTQSRYSMAGALKKVGWTPEKQAKFLLRHLLCDIKNGCFFTSYFSCMDMVEALNGTNGDLNSYLDYGYFGVLGADFDEQGRSVGTYTPKPSYYALQNLCAVLRDDYKQIPLPVRGTVRESAFLRDKDHDFDRTSHVAFEKPNGGKAVIYWEPCNIMTQTFESTVSLLLDDGVKNADISLVDLMDGKIYDLHPDMMEDGALVNIPVKDSPLMLTFGDFLD